MTIDTKSGQDPEDRQLHQEHEERGIRAVLESISDAFFALDRDWCFTYLNRQAQVLLSRDDLLGKNIWEEFAPAVGTEFDRAYHQAMDENVTVQFEACYAPHERWYEVNVYPAPEGLSVYFRDINERRRAEERERRLLAEAAEANAKFRAFFEQGALFAGIMDVDGTILEPNRLSWEACGFTREQIIGKPFWECPWWSPSPGLMGQIRQASAQAAAGQAYRAEMPYFVADGSQRMVDLLLLPIKDEAGQVMFLAPTGTDITERKRAEADRERLEHDLRQLAANLSEADRRKDEFLAMLAHELRNPLAPIRNSLEILRRSEGKPEAVRWASGIMERQVNQMVRLVDDLLDVSRITRGRIDLRRERTDLASILQQAVETSRPAIEAARQELRLSLPPEPVPLDADPVRLAQVFSNLLNNACKYSEPGGRITLTAERQGPEVVVRVKDTGVGIDPDLLPHIFELFRQADQSLERAQGGLGIGLTLVERLVTMHGGSVSAFSEGRGQGSELVVRLPVPSPP